jgi:hypothetical protein
MRRLLSLLHVDRRGNTAAEFALVLPLLLLFIFGLIDAGRFIWTCNRAEKATQMGVRYAVTTNMVPEDLYNYKFTSQGVVGGEPVPSGSFDRAECTSLTCNCYPSGVACGFRSAAFTKIVEQMRLFYPELTADNVEVVYKNVGLGYAGDPNGPDVSPLVTVSLKQVEFQPITFLLFGASLAMPSFSAALTMEDGVGEHSN